MMNTLEPNELDLRLLGVSGLSPWDGYTSSPRKQMFASHITQRLCIENPSERFVQTGMEREYGKYTFSIKAPFNMRTHAIIDRYPKTIDRDSIKYNPQRLVIVENVDTREYDILNITQYAQYHQYFGFPYKETPASRQMTIGSMFPKDTIFMDAGSKASNGGYMYGRELNVVYMSIPGVAEDGFVICEDVLENFAYPIYEQRTVEFGSKRYPLNTYGSIDEYRIMPDIGEYVREDSILMALRNHDKDAALMDQSVYSLMMVDATYDTKTYVSKPGGRVVDIRVQHDPYSAPRTTPQGMDKQAEKYNNARRQFYSQILSEYYKLKSRYREGLRISRRFHRMIVEAKGVMENSESLKIQKLYRKAPLDDWRIEFTIEHRVVPKVGAKITGTHGDKGVIVEIRKREDMPRDAYGNYADLAACGIATVNRMNVSRDYEQYINAARRDVGKHVTSIFMGDVRAPVIDDSLRDKPITIHDVNRQIELNRKNRFLKQQLEETNAKSPDTVKKAFEYLTGFYRLVNPDMANWFDSGQYQGRPIDHLYSIMSNDIFLYSPPNNQKSWDMIVEDVEKYYPPMRSAITFRGLSGDMKTTVKDDIFIGSVYIMILEKTGDDRAAISSAKTQCHGVIAQITNTDKYALPGRSQAIRAYGESEVRIMVSYVGPYFTAEILDRNNNPDSHNAVLQSIYSSDTPTNIEMAVDRTKIPLGGSKPLQLVNHILECGGIRFKYTPYVPKWNYNDTIITANYQAPAHSEPETPDLDKLVRMMQGEVEPALNDKE